ncbi:MlaD family protein [Gordonia soli]|uniref:Mce family protein n=1 Tax=Gordonia soli NBRC 108243 TaxID=1223545 RepID=M0QJQ4_9ACTN|nr:MlaD family protein [Gordonia soli]GAC68506.1 Mce family protein [Gordonia soli NBRC 108243]
MTRHTSQDFIRGDLRGQLRTLGLVGGVSILVMALVIAVIWVVYPRATAPEGTDVALVVPALGPGVKVGSKVLLRGSEVGEVTDVSSPRAGDVRVDVVLTDSATSVLTDSFDVDFRPENYFGITAVNLIAKPGGTPLTDGQVVARDSSPDFTMSTMLEQGSLVVDGTLTKDMIASLDEVIRYADGLAPLIRSSIIVADSIAKTQKHLPSTLIRRANNVLTEFPSFNRGVMDALFSITESPYNKLPDGSRGVDEAFHTETDKALEIASSDLFGKAGALLASHDRELTPLTTLLEKLADPLPGVIGGGVTMDKTISLIDGLESAFDGDEKQRTLKLRIVLDSMPGVAGPLAQMGVTQRQARGGR